MADLAEEVIDSVNFYVEEQSREQGEAFDPSPANWTTNRRSRGGAVSLWPTSTAAGRTTASGC